jgi:membrane-bound ClpP family serine protease
MKKKIAKKDKPETGFALGKENYKLMAIGFAVIVVGFILMVGGGSEDPDVFNPEIFSFRRITLAPLLLLFGFLFEIYAILKKPKDEE